MSEKQPERKPKPNPPNQTDGRRPAPAADTGREVGSLEFDRSRPREDEVSLDDVRHFLDYPYSLPAEKIPSLVEYYGHIREIADRLITRTDCPPAAVSTACQLHGHDPEFAYRVIKDGGQLGDDANRQLRHNHRHDQNLALNQLYYQQLPDDSSWETYHDYYQDRYVLLMMAQHQPDLPPQLVRQFYSDHYHQAEFVIALTIGQTLPEKIARRAFASYWHLPEFVVALCRHQQNLPGDLIAEIYNSRDRGFEAILDHSSTPSSVFGDLGHDVFESTLPQGGNVIDLSTMRRVRVGEGGGGSEEVPAVVFDQAHRDYRDFLGITIDLLTNNQLPQDMIRTVYGDFNQTPSVVKTMFEFQQSIPPDIIGQACRDYDKDIMFVEVLFKNQKDLPQEIIGPIYQKHRFNPLFDGDWLANQANLTPAERQEASRWRQVTDPETEIEKQQKEIGSVALGSV